MQRKVDFMQQAVMTSSVAGPRGNSKALAKAKLATTNKKVTVTVWSSAAKVIHYSFLNPSETLTSEKHAQQIDEMHQKLQHLHRALVKRKGPVLLHDKAQLHTTRPRLQQLKGLGYKVLPHLPYSPDFLSANYHFFKHLDNFLQGKCFHHQQEAENAFQEFNES